MIPRIACILVVTLLILTSCEVTDNSDSTSGNGILQVYLTDAPADYEAVWIEIEEVRIHHSTDENIEENDNGWITISQEPKTVNLLDLTNGELEALGETELEPGRYSQIRLVLGDNNTIVKDGVTHSLTTPSAQQSGLKINIHADVEGGQVYTLLLDFDASRSVVEAGKSGKFILKPVLRTVELTNTGTIEGTIEPADSLPWIYAIAEEDTIAGTKASVDGEFRIIGLLSGTYQLAINPDEGAYKDTVLTDIEVTAPDTTQIGVITLEE